MPTLTAAGISRIKPPAKGQTDYFDNGYPGLALRVSYGGGRSFVYFYRYARKQHRLTLGQWPSMSLAEARNAWRAAREAVSRGDNPTHRRAADSLAATVADWLKRDQSANRSVERVAGVMNRDVLPILGDRQMTTIKRRDLIEVIDTVADRGYPIAARRLHAYLHRLFRWSVGRGIIELNPMADLPKPGEEISRDRVLTDKELAAVWNAAADWPFGPMIRLLILTGARRDEIRGLRWSEIDGDEIKLEGARTKNGEPRTIPLAPAAVEIIEALPHIGDGFVFTTTGRTHISGLSKAKKRLDKAAHIKPWRLHDVRRTAATGMQRIGIGLQVIESVLGHSAGSRAGIVQVYQRHQFNVEKRQALNAWALEVGRIMSGESAAIVPMVRRPG